MFTPKKTKYRKVRKAKTKEMSCRDHLLSFGEIGLKATSQARIDGKQIESARRVITRVIAKSGKLWIRIFPNLPVTKKPTDVRMGGGKGSIDRYVFCVAPGRMLFELEGVEAKLAKLAFDKACAKLPCTAKVVYLT